MATLEKIGFPSKEEMGVLLLLYRSLFGLDQ